MEASRGDIRGTTEDVAAARLKAKEFYQRPRAELAEVAHAANDWAGFWKRLAASWVDGLVLYVPMMIAVMIGAMVARESAAAAFISFVLLPLLVFVLYHGLLTGGTSVATPGRMATGIAIVNGDDGRPLSFGKSIARAVVSFISLWLIIPNLFVPFTEKKQSVADMMVGSTVVSYRPANGVVIAVVVLFFGIAIIGILAAIAIPQYQDYVMRARAAEAHADLRGYAVIIEEDWRRTGRPPESLTTLSYSPKSKVAKFAVMKNGSVVAELPAGASKASLGLVPSYDRVTDTMTWKCLAQGWTVKSQRLRECEHVD